MNTSSQYNILLSKLHGFIRRFYLDKIIKGGFLFLIGVSSLFVLLVLTEYLGYFSSSVRTVLYFGFLLFSISIFIWFLLIPLLGLLKIGKALSIEEAAVILGRHFKTDVDDKILNTIQLHKATEISSYNSDLILASIEQKSSKLIPIRFSNAVNIRQNTRYVPPFILLVSLIVLGWFLFPYIFKDSATRLMNYQQEYERPAPFSLSFINDLPLRGIKNQGFQLGVLAEGIVLPNDMKLQIDNKSFAMVKKEANRFEYEFRSIGQPLEFFIIAGGYSFGPYSIDVRSRSVIKNFVIEADYPPYTNLTDESFNNIGDLSIPEGTVLNWVVYAEDTEHVIFAADSIEKEFEKEREGVFQFRTMLLNDLDYQVSAVNESNVIGDSLAYTIRSVADTYPAISMEEYQDSVMISHLFYKGVISDDYGFTNLGFRFRVLEKVNDTNEKIKFNNLDIPFERNNLNQEFYHHVDLQKYDIKPGMSMEYFFEVYDNDAVNGPKLSRSFVYSLDIPDYDELLAETVAADEEIKSGLSESIKEVNTIQEEIDKLRRSMLESENVSWEQQESLKNLLEKQKSAQESYEQLKKFSEDQNTKAQQFNPQNEEILKKQEELEKLFDEVLSDEMKELYKQIQEEMEKLNKEKAFEMLDQMKFEMEDMEQRLDRALELFKQLQVERMLSESIKSIERIKEQQDELTEEVELGNNDESTKEEQKAINEKFEKLSDLLEEMTEKNQELSRPNPLEDTGEMEEGIKKDLEKALNELEKSDTGNAGKSQKGASGKMQQLQQSLMDMQAQMQQENLAEDIRTLRVILDNLIKTSFSQEMLMDEVTEINIRDPRYISLIQNQRKISDDLVLIKDSLKALAKRQIQIESVVSREIADINLNIEQAIDHLVNRRKQNGVARQQFVMTHVNNLALLLNESMQNMQNQMQMQGQGQGQPQSGQGAEGMQDLRQMQEQMNKMLEQLREGHQQMPGESGKPGMGMSEQLARMAAEQEAIRKRLGELKNQLGGDGESTGELDELMREMERTELDIVTNRITRQTHLRQQKIVTRLLEHEKALMEREQEERRVGETAKFYEYSNPQEFFEYNRNTNRAIDMLKSLPPEFKPYYKSLVELYFLNVQE